MAEFSEVIRQANRLCKEDRCITETCPLLALRNGRSIGCDQLRKQYPEEFEAIVMKWAEEHPVMTNGQKLLNVVTETFGEKISKEFSEALVVPCAILGSACDGECPNCEFQGFWDKEYQPPKGED